MIEFPEQYEKTCKEFIMAYFNGRRWELEQAFLGMQIQPAHPAEEFLYGSALADQLAEIARAAAGAIEHSEDGFTEGVISEGIQDLCERLFAPPGLGSAYDIPARFWDTPLGQMLARAMLWIQRDELVTIRELAEEAGVSMAAVSQAIDAGKLRAYIDPDTDSPQRERRKISRKSADRWLSERK